MEALHRIALIPALVIAVSIAVAGCGSPPAASPAGAQNVGSHAPQTGAGGEKTPEPDPTAEPTGELPPDPATTHGNAGCRATGGGIPAGADTSEIEDVDGDGLADTQFYSESHPFHYGIHTASGATAVLGDDLAGPGGHYGWSARLANGLVVTVLDDSRSATLHAFIDCRFVTTFAPDGEPFRVHLKGFGDHETGISCGVRDNGRQLVRMLALNTGDGMHDITRTVVQVSEDGTRAWDGDTSTWGTGVPASDERVKRAMTSSCENVRKVGTSGR